MSEIKRGTASKGAKSSGTRKPRAKRVEGNGPGPEQSEAMEPSNERDSTDAGNSDAPAQLEVSGKDGNESDLRCAPAASEEREPAPPRPDPMAQARMRPADEYSVYSYFDRNAKMFAAAVVEFPELKATSNTRETVLVEIERKLESELQKRKQNNEPMPEPIHARRYPDKLDLAISQGLFRRLDLLSRHEKVSLDQLVVELLTASVEKRLAPASQQQQQQPQHHERDRDRRPQGRSQNNNNNQQQRGNNNNQRQQHNNNSNSNNNNRRAGQGRNYHDTMDNRENFMEYVRNLEKGGGPGGSNWRKK